jgi:hypothetical protein
LEVQEQIVRELEGYAAIISGAKQIVENWMPIVEQQADWDVVEISEVCTVIGGGTPDRKIDEYWGPGIPWLSARYIGDDHSVTGFEEITKKGLENSSSKIAPVNSTILITRVSVGKYAFADKDYAINQDLTALVSKTPKLDEKFLSYAIGVVANFACIDAVSAGNVNVGVNVGADDVGSDDFDDVFVSEFVCSPTRDVKSVFVGVENFLGS